MRRTYDEIHNLIINFTIDFLQEHEPKELYNEVICKELSIYRHTLYNHFKNISEIYEQIKIKANELFTNSFTDYKSIEEHINQGIQIERNNRKLIKAIYKINSNFFTEFYQNFKHAKLKKNFSNIKEKHFYWLKTIQNYGIVGFIDTVSRNAESYDEEEITDFLCKLIKKIENCKLLDD